MSQLDLLILVVYTIVVIYVMIRAIESVDKKAKIEFNTTRFNQKLEEYELLGKIAVGFGFAGRYAMHEMPTQLAMTVANNSNTPIFIDWDRSSINGPGGRSHRAIRITPYDSPDLSKPQMATVIPPTSSVQEIITAENALSAPNSANPQILQPTRPILGPGSTSTLWLVFQMGEQERAHRGDRLYVLPCDIVSTIMPWTDSLPWKS